MPDAYTTRKLSARYPTDLGAWTALARHYKEVMRQKTLSELFARDKKRAQRFQLAAGDLTLDYAKNHINAATHKLLVRLAKEADVPGAVRAMFAGEHINKTEDRPVLHVALRAKISDTVALETPGVRDIWEVLVRMEEFVERVQTGAVVGATGKRLTNIVNIGIGGSDLGPVMVSRALRTYWRDDMRFDSVSNVDGTQLADLQEELDPESTLFVICSKTFTTLETMTNAKAARAWIVERLGERAVVSHFVAASTNHSAMNEFGIHSDYRFGFWDWVGGRYSIWSAVGLSVALVTGMDIFRRLLAGARVMDLHFQQAPLHANMPVTLALLGIWYNNFFGAETQAILPYDNRLERFPAYLQQLHMESNGKSVRLDGKPVKCSTGVVIWGEAGNNAQHSFYQLLHQGTRLIPIDFLLPVQSSGARQAQQDLAIANCLAQSEALMDGQDAPSDEPYRSYKGNNPSNTIVFPALTPETLGQLIALYEHKVFVEGVIWGIDSFDQWGVELGKKVASSLTAAVSGEGQYQGGNASSASLLEIVSRER
ncbi:MAG TPA: glucose-6-phosphate isomerase [Woeseiaceae bacterium]|nr:glucose-6-phosphate isomerase [Woeseiaceae bacterium]